MFDYQSVDVPTSDNRLAHFFCQNVGIAIHAAEEICSGGLTCPPSPRDDGLYVQQEEVSPKNGKFWAWELVEFY